MACTSRIPADGVASRSIAACISLRPTPRFCVRWIDSNRADTRNQGPLVETIASDDAAAAFRHHTVKAGWKKSMESAPAAALVQDIEVKPCFALSFRKASNKFNRRRNCPPTWRREARLGCDSLA